MAAAAKLTRVSTSLLSTGSLGLASAQVTPFLALDYAYGRMKGSLSPL